MKTSATSEGSNLTVFVSLMEYVAQFETSHCVKEFFLVCIFLYSDWLFNPNIRKYGPEKAPHLDTFHTVSVSPKDFRDVHSSSGLTIFSVNFSSRCVFFFRFANKLLSFIFNCVMDPFVNMEHFALELFKTCTVPSKNCQ